VFRHEKMAAGVGGLQTALILIGFIVRFQPNFNNNIEVYDVRLENLGLVYYRHIFFVR
jgi:hypothetical protein